MGILLFGSVSGDDIKRICGFAAFGDGSDGNEKYCVGAVAIGVCVTKKAWGQVTDFFSIASLPKGAFTTSGEFGVLCNFTSVGIESFAMEGKRSRKDLEVCSSSIGVTAVGTTAMVVVILGSGFHSMSLLAAASLGAGAIAKCDSGCWLDRIDSDR